MNKARTNTTTEYTRCCEAALLVAPIARVETDNQVHKRLGQLHRMFGKKKALVVTKIDVNLKLQVDYLSMLTMRHQETRSLNNSSALEPTSEAAKEHERLILAKKHTIKEISRLVNSRNTARGEIKETLTQQISKMQSVILILFVKAC